MIETGTRTRANVKLVLDRIPVQWTGPRATLFGFVAELRTKDTNDLVGPCCTGWHKTQQRAADCGTKAWRALPGGAS